MGKKKMKGRGRSYMPAEEKEMLERQERIVRSKDIILEDGEDGREIKEDWDTSSSEGSGSGSGSEDSSEFEKSKKPKGPVVEGFEVCNPNDVKTITKKAGELDLGQKRELTRREREAIEAERAKRQYEKLHAQGKTDEAKADLARLAEIRKQREEAAEKRAEEKRQKEEEKVRKAEALKAALGNKGQKKGGKKK
eukprot:Clim_evm49s172 gene=Clim_evmTU49s172